MLTINGAGGAAGDPFLAGLGMLLTLGASTFDVAQVNEAGIDQVSGFPITQTMKAALSPAATVLTSGTSGGYNDTTKQWNIGDTSGLSVGDYIYLFHGSITPGLYPIASIVDGANVTIVGNPLNSAGNQSNVSFQVAWTWEGAAGAAPSVSSVGGTENWFKAELQDANPVVSQSENNIYLRDLPASPLAIAGGGHSGGTVSDTALALAVLSAWANKGGVTHVEMANHSGQGVNNFTWTNGGGTGENTVATAQGGLTIASGDGMKYGRLILKGSAGSAYTVGIDIDVNLDTSGPGIILQALAA